MPDENFYNLPNPEELYTQELKIAVEQHPNGSLIYLKKTKQIVVVNEVKATADGIAIRARNIGLVPIAETRGVTEEDLNNSVFSDKAEKRGEHFFLRD